MSSFLLIVAAILGVASLSFAGMLVWRLVASKQVAPNAQAILVRDGQIVGRCESGIHTVSPIGQMLGTDKLIEFNLHPMQVEFPIVCRTVAGRTASGAICPATEITLTAILSVEKPSDAAGLRQNYLADVAEEEKFQRKAKGPLTAVIQNIMASRTREDVEQRLIGVTVQAEQQLCLPDSFLVRWGFPVGGITIVLRDAKSPQKVTDAEIASQAKVVETTGTLQMVMEAQLQLEADAKGITVLRLRRQLQASKSEYDKFEQKCRELIKPPAPPAAPKGNGQGNRSGKPRKLKDLDPNAPLP